MESQKHNHILTYFTIVYYCKIVHYASVTDLLTTKQLMEILHVDRTTIYRMMNDGRLPAVRVGGQWRFRRQSIDQWLSDDKPTIIAERKSDSGSTPLVSNEILPAYCLQSIQEVFAQTSDVGAITTDLNGKTLTSVSNSCAACNLILASGKGRARCEASWSKLADQAANEPRLEKCHAGFVYARGRVTVADQFIAMFFVGQFVIDTGTSIQSDAHIKKLADECGVDKAALKQALSKINILKKDRAEKMLHLLQLVADTYSHIGQERLGLLTRLKRVAEIAGVPPAI
jgi:excisionase family DNA binding protein